MNLLEAVETGLPFKREGHNDWTTCNSEMQEGEQSVNDETWEREYPLIDLESGDMVAISRHSMLATDYEVKKDNYCPTCGVGKGE